MKLSKLIVIALLVSAYATVSVINIQLAKPKDVSEVTLDMLDIMSKAFDEGEGWDDDGEEMPGLFWEKRQTNTVCTRTRTITICHPVEPNNCWSETVTYNGKMQVCDPGWQWCRTKCVVDESGPA